MILLSPTKPCFRLAGPYGLGTVHLAPLAVLLLFLYLFLCFSSCIFNFLVSPYVRQLRIGRLMRGIYSFFSLVSFQLLFWPGGIQDPRTFSFYVASSSQHIWIVQGIVIFFLDRCDGARLRLSSSFPPARRFHFTDGVSIPGDLLLSSVL